MRKSFGTVVLVLLLGIIIGAVLSEIVALFLTEGSVAEQLFVSGESFGFMLDTLNLIVLDLTLGISVHVNLMSVVGVFVAAQILRWYR